MKVNDTVKLIKGSMKGKIGIITEIKSEKTVEVYFEHLKDNYHISSPYKVYLKDYLEVITNESISL